MKPGVLRYGPPPNENTHTGQSPIRPNVSMAQGGPPGTPDPTHNSIYQSQQGGFFLFTFFFFFFNGEFTNFINFRITRNMLKN